MQDRVIRLFRSYKIVLLTFFLNQSKNQSEHNKVFIPSLTWSPFRLIFPQIPSNKHSGKVNNGCSKNPIWNNIFITKSRLRRLGRSSPPPALPQCPITLKFHPIHHLLRSTSSNALKFKFLPAFFYLIIKMNGKISTLDHEEVFPGVLWSIGPLGVEQLPLLNIVWIRWVNKQTNTYWKLYPKSDAESVWSQRKGRVVGHFPLVFIALANYSAGASTKHPECGFR